MWYENRNGLTVIENKLVVIKEERTGGGFGKMTSTEPDKWHVLIKGELDPH